MSVTDSGEEMTAVLTSKMIYFLIKMPSIKVCYYNFYQQLKMLGFEESSLSKTSSPTLSVSTQHDAASGGLFPSLPPTAEALNICKWSLSQCIFENWYQWSSSTMLDPIIWVALLGILEANDYWGSPYLIRKVMFDFYIFEWKFLLSFSLAYKRNILWKNYLVSVGH